MENIGLYLEHFSSKLKYYGIFVFNEDTNFNIKYIQNNCYIFITKENNIKIYPDHSLHSNEEEFLFQVEIKNNTFYLSNPFCKKYLLKPNPDNINIFTNKLWYAVNHLPKKEGKEIIGQNEEYYLNEGDIFKIETEIFYVTKINIKNYKKTNNNELLKFEPNWIFDTISQTKILDNSNLCVHIINDLKEGKNLEKIHKVENITSRNKRVLIYRINLKRCEKCEKYDMIYPLNFKLTENSKITELVHIEEPDKDKNYIKIESLEKPDKFKKFIYKYIYIIELTGEEEEFILGNEGDIQIYLNNDILKSFYKSAIKYNKKNGKLVLENLGEKTGTMVLIQNNYFEIPKNKEIYLQSGKTFFKAKIMNKEEYEKIKNE